MDFFQHLQRSDLPRVDHDHVQRARGLGNRLLSTYLRIFNERLKPMKPIALVNGMPAYDLTQPPLQSAPGARVLRTGLNYMLLKKEARPINMVLMTNMACDMKCRHCSARTYMRSGRKPLAYEEIIDLVDQFVELGGASFILSGGEPSLHPRVLDIVAHVPKDKAVVSMFTNGSQMVKLADELKSAGLFGTLVSLDSTDPGEHDRVRGMQGGYDRAMAAVEKLKSLGMLVGLSTYITRAGHARGDFQSIVRLGTELGVHQVFVFDTVPTGALLKEKDLVLRQQDRDELRELTKAQNANPVGPAIMGQSWVNSREGFGCFAGFYQLYVNAAGDVMPCDFTPITFGNIREERLETIWKRLRSSEEWGTRFPECRMQDAAFRARTVDLLPPDAELPVPYETLVSLRGKQQQE